jgi:hypothetical protein
MQQGIGWCIAFVVLLFIMVYVWRTISQMVDLAYDQANSNAKSSFCSPCALGRKCHTCGKYGGGCGCSYYGTELGMIPKYVMVD